MTGPPFLLKPKTEWPNERKAESEAQIEDLEKRKSPNSLAAVTKPQPLLNAENFSDWEKLIRVTAYCQRFANNIRFFKKDPSKLRREELQPEECKEDENYWIREAQRELIVADYPNLSPLTSTGSKSRRYRWRQPFSFEINNGSHSAFTFVISNENG